MQFKLTPELIKQLLRFSVVGGTAFLIDFGFLCMFKEVFGINVLVASAFSFTISVVYNYILSTHWVFDVDEGHSKVKDLTVFIVLSVIGLGINQLMMWLMVDLMGIFYMLSKIVATAFVTVYNFVTRKIFLEGDKGKAAGQ